MIHNPNKKHPNNQKVISSKNTQKTTHSKAKKMAKEWASIHLETTTEINRVKESTQKYIQPTGNI